jgi:hypothetical protein
LIPFWAGDQTPKPKTRSFFQLGSKPERNEFCDLGIPFSNKIWTQHTLNKKSGIKFLQVFAIFVDFGVAGSGGDDEPETTGLNDGGVVHK